MKTGVIDTGGGLRGIYAAGVLDRFMEEDITFDVGIGVSAGSANIASFISGQKKRNYAFYTEYSQRDEYMSRANIRSKGCYLDVRYIYGTLSNTDGENPLDFSAFCGNPMKFIAVATDVLNGQTVYFDKSDVHLNYYNVLMASSAMPYMCVPQDVNAKLYFDGAVSDPIPLEKALEEGCEKIVLILNQPLDEKWNGADDARLVDRLEKQYPAIADTLRGRAENITAVLSWRRSLKKPER